jgi:ornithine--oxo-acid transaminase
MSNITDSSLPSEVAVAGGDVVSILAERGSERYALHSRYMNEMMVRVLRTLGYAVCFCRGEGQYLFDRNDQRYLDLVSGWGVFGIGRNHPKLRKALTDVLARNLANLVQMDVSPLAGLLAERLLRYVPFLEKVLFVNSGAEAVEAAIKLARRATNRPGLVYCAHSFHGLSCGALSLTGDSVFREGFAPAAGLLRDPI